MSNLGIKTVLAPLLALAMLTALAGCDDDRRDHVRPAPDRHPERYERHDNDRHEERHDSDRHEDRERPSEHERGERDKR